MSEARDACSEVLRSLLKTDGLIGSCLISRDGLPILAEWPHPADIDTLAAMSAALMGAAETSLMEFGDRSLETVLIVSKDRRMVILGVDDELLLLAAMDRSLPIEAFDATLHDSLSKLTTILAEA